MTTKKVYFTLLLILIYQNFYSQIFFANNALIQINSNAVVHTNGGVILTNGTDLTIMVHFKSLKTPLFLKREILHLQAQQLSMVTVYIV
jgi:hypothetical protein